MSALDGVKVTTKALDDLADRLRGLASALRGLAEALGGLGLDAYARRCDGIASRVHGAAMRAETIRLVLSHHADVEITDTQPILYVPTCYAFEAGAEGCEGQHGMGHRLDPR